MEKPKLPDGWVWKPLEKIARIYSGSSAPQEQKYFIDGKYPFVRVRDVGAYGKTTNLQKTRDYLNDLALKDYTLVSAKKGTIVFPKSGAAILTNNRAILGIDSYIVGHLAAICPDENKSLIKYLYYWLCTVDFAEKVKTTALPSLKLSEIKKIQTPLPPLAEQRRIVARIEDLVGRAVGVDKLFEETSDIENAVFQAAVNDIWKNEAKWPQKTLGELATTVVGQIDPREVPFVNMHHINGKVIESTTCKLLDNIKTAKQENLRSGKYHFKAGAVLYSKIRPYLKKAVQVPFEGICSADVYAFDDISSELSPRFFMYSLISPRFTEYANRMSIRARIPKLNQKQLFVFQLSYPKIEIQQQIVACLDALQTKTNELRRIQSAAQKELDALVPAILDNAFRGAL